MYILLFLASLYCNITKYIQPDETVVCYFQLQKDSSELYIKLFKLDANSKIGYRILKDGVFFSDSSEDEEDYSILEKELNRKIDEQGTYKLTLFNSGDQGASVNIYSHMSKALGNEDNDVKAIKKLFGDIENKLINLYNTNLRLKHMQEKNIIEAKRIINGLYVMFLIPVVYFLVGLAKVKAVKMMFAPKKGLKP